MTEQPFPALVSAPWRSCSPQNCCQALWLLFHSSLSHSYMVVVLFLSREKKINIYQKTEKIHVAIQQQQDFFITGNCMKTVSICHKPDSFCLLFEAESTFMNDITKPPPSKMLSCWDLAASTPWCWALHQITFKCLLQFRGQALLGAIDFSQTSNMTFTMGIRNDAEKKHSLNNRVCPITIITFIVPWMFPHLVLPKMKISFSLPCASVPVSSHGLDTKPSKNICLSWESLSYHRCYQVPQIFENYDLFLAEFFIFFIISTQCDTRQQPTGDLLNCHQSYYLL